MLISGLISSKKILKNNLYSVNIKLDKYGISCRYDTENFKSRKCLLPPELFAAHPSLRCEVP